MTCEDCGGTATHRWPDDDHPTCLACARAALAHGHRHVHDEPEDCRLDLEPLAGHEPARLRCSS